MDKTGLRNHSGIKNFFHRKDKNKNIESKAPKAPKISTAKLIKQKFTQSLSGLKGMFQKKNSTEKILDNYVENDVEKFGILDRFGGGHDRHFGGVREDDSLERSGPQQFDKVDN